jgi:hypothetical protein
MAHVLGVPGLAGTHKKREGIPPASEFVLPPFSEFLPQIHAKNI